MQLLIFFSFNIKYFFNFNILSIFKSYYIILYHIYIYDNKMNVNKYTIKNKLHI